MLHPPCSIIVIMKYHDCNWISLLYSLMFLIMLNVYLFPLMPLSWPESYNFHWMKIVFKLFISNKLGNINLSSLQTNHHDYTYDRWHFVRRFSASDSLYLRVNPDHFNIFVASSNFVARLLGPDSTSSLTYSWESSHSDFIQSCSDSSECTSRRLVRL